MAAASVVPSDIFPVLRRFFADCGLERTLKAFNKESGVDDDVPPRKLKKGLAKRLAVLDLTEACKFWLESEQAAVASVVDATEAKAEASTAEVEVQDGGSAKKPKNKKGAQAQPVIEDDASVAVETEEPPKKKGTQKDASEAVECKEAPVDAANDKPTKRAAAVAEEEQAPKKQKNAQEKPAGVPFKRVDESKWNATIKDSRMMDNTHKAKLKFGGGDGDTWGDKASEDLLKVKGKGFRKEMAKKKRASWRGGGSIDQGVNSIKFDGSSDEE